MNKNRSKLALGRVYFPSPPKTSERYNTSKVSLSTVYLSETQLTSILDLVPIVYGKTDRNARVAIGRIQPPKTKTPDEGPEGDAPDADASNSPATSATNPPANYASALGHPAPDPNTTEAKAATAPIPPAASASSPADVRQSATNLPGKLVPGPYVFEAAIVGRMGKDDTHVTLEGPVKGMTRADALQELIWQVEEIIGNSWGRYGDWHLVDDGSENLEMSSRSASTARFTSDGSRRSGGSGGNGGDSHSDGGDHGKGRRRSRNQNDKRSLSADPAGSDVANKRQRTDNSAQGGGSKSLIATGTIEYPNGDGAERTFTATGTTSALGEYVPGSQSEQEATGGTFAAMEEFDKANRMD
jgi:hypothetical protein